MMLAVRSHANTKIIQLARCKIKVSWLKLVGIRPTQIYYRLKKIFEYVNPPMVKPFRLTYLAKGGGVVLPPSPY